MARRYTCDRAGCGSEDAIHPEGSHVDRGWTYWLDANAAVTLREDANLLSVPDLCPACLAKEMVLVLPVLVGKSAPRPESVVREETLAQVRREMESLIVRAKIGGSPERSTVFKDDVMFRLDWVKDHPDQPSA